MQTLHRIRPRRILLSAFLFSFSASLATAQTPVPGGPAPGTGPVTAEERHEVVEGIARHLEERYVFADIGVATGRHLTAELARGAFDGLTDPKRFAEALTSAMQSISRDKHMRATVKPPEAAMADRVDPIAEHLRGRQKMEEGNYGFHTLERREGNIGYLDLRGFAPFGLARDKAIAAMSFLDGSDAIVIDLRRNGGGDPNMVRFLSSYFFEKPTHLNSLYWREGERTEEFWTVDDVPGRRMTDVPVFVLTSGYTFSAAEEFSYNMQAQRRATLIGETTGGGANPGGVYPANERFGVFVPTGRAINPVTNTNWEGKGVVPEIAMSAGSALDTALALAREAAEAHRAQVAERAGAARATLAAELKRAEALFAKKSIAEGSRTVDAALDAARKGDLVDEGLINWLGYDYLGRKEHAMAIAVFEYNTKAFPESGNTYDSLGEALMNAGDTTSAIANYRRALELDPRNDNARAMIARMSR